MTSTAGEPEAIVAVDDGVLALTVSVGADGIARLTASALGTASRTRRGAPNASAERGREAVVPGGMSSG